MKLSIWRGESCVTTEGSCLNSCSYNIIMIIVIDKSWKLV